MMITEAQVQDAGGQLLAVTGGTFYLLKRQPEQTETAIS
jgi:hypothetical protein